MRAGGLLPIAVLATVAAGAANADAGADARNSARNAAAAAEFFENRIRPLLVAHCQECHGGKARKGGLKLDSAKAVLRGGDTGAVVVPGEPDKSLLVQSVRYDGDLKMPPKGRLSAAQIADLAEWVRQGAVWPGAAPVAPPTGTEGGMVFTEEQRNHWAWQPIADPVPPAVRDAAWVRSPIDRFVLSRLEAAGLRPAPEADRRTLLRRVTFDLTGLPPTPAEIDAFLADDSPTAWEKVIDRLQASPAYGERFGRHWLDVARYADSNGLDENTAFANAWRYRDYVVAAFNADKPFDRFVVEQLAGDLLPADADPKVDRERLVATGFLVLGPKLLAEPDKQKMVMDIVDEQIDTAGKAFLALTLGCARCHDHKFDPLPTRDYYALAGIFKSTKTMATLATVARAHERPLADPEAVAAAEAHGRRLKAAADALKKASDQARQEAAGTLRRDAARYLIAATALIAAAKPDPAAAAKAAGLDAEVLKRWASRLRKAGADDPVFGPWKTLAAAKPGEFAEAARAEAARHIGAGANPAVAAALFEGGPPASPAEAADRYAALFADVGAEWDKTPERKRAKAVLPDAGRETVRQILAEPNGPFALPAKPEGLYPAETRDRLARLAAEEAELRKNAPPPVPMCLAVADEAKPADVRVHIRGNHLTLGEVAPKVFPRILAGDAQTPLDNRSSGRLELARWMTRPDHPLTPRVIVNRVWGWHFGEGLVRSPDNFGKLGQRPTHPELLDWLARRFVEDGWSIKALNKRILMSAAYRMSTAHDPAAALADPENRLRWRFERRRLEVEAIRDAVLAVSGRLDRTMGGTLLETRNFEYVTNDRSRNKARYDVNRRSIYLPVVRNAVYDVFQVFDFVEPGVGTGRRAVTTVAPQALFLLNGKFMLDNSRALAESLLADAAASDDARLHAVYLRAYGRPPTDEESAILREYLAAYAGKAAGVEPDPDKRRLLAWQGLCQVLLAGSEFVYVE